MEFNMQIQEFTGIHKEGIGFLEALKFHNEPTFFNANKEIYTLHLREPLVLLVNALSNCINEIDPRLDTRPKRTICRIRRDARFAKGEPYRTNMWFSYKPIDKNNYNYFTYYFYFDTKSYGMGIGFYGMPRPLMQAFRDRIEANPTLFEKVINTNVKKYNLGGEDYKRPVKKIVLPDDIGKWYNKKRFYIDCDYPLDDVFFSSKLVDKITKVYKDLIPLYDFVIGQDVRF